MAFDFNSLPDLTDTEIKKDKGNLLDFGSLPELTESQRDIQEEQTRPGAIGVLGGVASGAKSEIKGLFDTTKFFAKKGIEDLQTLTKRPDVREEDFNVKRLEGTKKKKQLIKRRGKQALEIAKNSPEIMKEIVVDMGKSFGFEGGRGFDVDVALDKWQRAPIESLLDATMIGGVLSKAAKSGSKALIRGANKRVPKEGKELIKNVISKGDPETYDLIKQIDVEVDTPLDDLYAESKILKGLSLGQLDNPNFSQSLGKRAVKNINELKKEDNILMKTAIDEIKDTPVNVSEIKTNIFDGLRKKGFLKEGTDIIDEDFIEVGLGKKALIDEIKFLNQSDTKTLGINAKKLKQRMDALDDKINWKTPKEVDKGVMEVRKAYRNELRQVSPKYDEVALEVSEKLDKFEPQLRRFEKSGAGEKFGKNPFQTKEELDEMIDFMDKSTGTLRKTISNDLKGLRAWHDWNRFFKQNPDFIIGEVPGLSSKFIPGIKKRAIKADIKLGKPRGRRLLKLAKSKPLRIGLEIQREGD